MAYTVNLEPAAERQLRKLTPQARAQVLPVIYALANNPRPSGVVKLEGAGGEYRVRSGDFRIVYTIEDAALIVLVVRIAHRRDVYR